MRSGATGGRGKRVLEIKEKLEVNLYEKESEVEGALARTENSLPSFAISFL